MLVMGIPSYRLDRKALKGEIDILKKMGVKFKMNTEVGKDVTIDKLRSQGYKGFYVAIGAQKSSKLNVPGEDLAGVFGGVDFLREVNLGNKPALGKKCAVIGGGNVAMDVCRTAVRLRLRLQPPLRGRLHPRRARQGARDRRDQEVRPSRRA